MHMKRLHTYNSNYMRVWKRQNYGDNRKKKNRCLLGFGAGAWRDE